MAHRPKSDFLKVMSERGFLSDCTDFERLDHALLHETVPGYIGFDATAESLHVGSLIQIMMLRWLQKTGHKPIILMGGGTTKVGDPSFRAEERPLLHESRISSNIAGIRKVFSKYVRFGDGRTDAVMPNNAEWLDGLNYLDFLRDIGRHFSVNRMLSFESVKSRLDRTQTLSFLEFNYMILQAFDFLELNRRFGCRLQMGGSDQWGNIVNGVDLARRVEDASVFGLTSPLLTTSDGRKMGKTAGGAVWMNAELLSPFDFWQYWRNVPDADVGRFLLLFTEINVEECRRLGDLRDSGINSAKIVLANHVTALAHGEKAAANAATTAERLFGGETAPSEERRSALPTLELSVNEVPDSGVPVVQLLVKSGLASTGKEARRLIASKGARLNGDTIEDSNALVSAEMLHTPLKLSAGRKRHVRVVLSDGQIYSTSVDSESPTREKDIPSKAVETKEANRPHWFVCSKKQHRIDRLFPFIDNGKWEYYSNEAKESVHDEYSKYLNEMAIGDRIAIFELGREKSSDFQEKHKIEISGRSVSYMVIWAIGRIIKPCSNNRIGVSWERIDNSRRWYSYTDRGQIWRVYPENNEGWGGQLIDFAFNGVEQNLELLYSRLKSNA